MADRHDDGFLSRWSRRKAAVREGREVAEPPPPAAPVTPVARDAAADAALTASLAAAVAPSATARALRGPQAVPPGSPLAEPPAAEDSADRAQSAVPTPTDVAPAQEARDGVTAPFESAPGVPSGDADARNGAIAAPPPTALAAPTAPPLPTMADVARLTRESDFSRFVRGDVEPDVRNAAMKKLFADPHYNQMDGLDVYIDDYNKADPLPRSVLRQVMHARILGLLDDELVEQDKPADAGGSAPRADNPPPDEDPDLQLQPHDAAGPGGVDDGVDVATHDGHAEPVDVAEHGEAGDVAHDLDADLGDPLANDLTRDDPGPGGSVDPRRDA